MAGFGFFKLFNRRNAQQPQPQVSHFGLYRGTVIDNADPQQMGRLVIEIPDVNELAPSTWALPCVPLAGAQMGTYFLPQIGASVWVQFERGDPDYPVWMGCWWGTTAQVPALAAAGIPGDPTIVIQSALQNAIVIKDTPGATGGVMLKSALGAEIIVNDTGIYIQNGKGASIVMLGPSVDVNEGKLVLT
jgi:uncharacterized protein involved in type VI secretion and phage assembly